MEGQLVKNQYLNGISAKLVGIFVCLSALFGVAGTAYAATLLLAPASGEYALGKTFSVTVYVSSADKPMNAASGIISFPADKLEVTSVSKSGSIITLWVQEPSFSNSAGSVSFEGIVYNPGYQKANGKIVTVNFKVKAAGTAQIKFSSAAVLANDGLGTNILSGLGSAKFTLGAPPTVPEPATPPVVIGTPSAAKISSATHPDPNKWYSKTDASFAWPLPSDVTSDRLLFGKIADAVPSVTYTPPVSGKQITNIQDGVWYFSVQLRNAKGWGDISHFRFQVDTTKPSSFVMTEITRGDPTDPIAKFQFDAKDDMSGIDHYEVKIDSGNVEVWNDNGSHRYETPVLEPGTHTLTVNAVDRAGNALTRTAQFEIKAIDAPRITEYPKTLDSNTPLTIRGATYPNGKVTLWIQKDADQPTSYKFTAGSDGMFTFTTDGALNEGGYSLWLEVTDTRGAKSLPGDKIAVIVSKTGPKAPEAPKTAVIGAMAADIFTIAVPLIALLFILLFIVWYAWYKFFATRKRLHSEVREAETTLHNTFSILRGDIRAQIKMLEKARTKRELTDEEEKIIKHLKHDLDMAEKFVKKELSNIEKVMK